MPHRIKKKSAETSWALMPHETLFDRTPRDPMRVFSLSHSLITHNRMEALRGRTSGLAPNDAGHLDIAKVGYFTDIRWSS